MALVWNPWALGWLVAAAAHAAVAVPIFLVRPWRLQNRALGLALFVEALYLTGIALSISVDSPGWAAAVQQSWATLAPASAFAYLLFVSTLDSPLARPLATRRARTALAAGTVVAPVILLVSGVDYVASVEATWFATWNPSNTSFMDLQIIVIALTLVFCLVVTTSALRRLPKHSHARTRMRSFVQAFIVRDSVVPAFAILYPLLRSQGTFGDLWFLAGALAFVPYPLLLAHGMLRHHTFGVETRLRRAISREPEDVARSLDRKHHVYRAALEVTLADPRPHPRDFDVLDALRRQLDVGRREHEAMVAEVRRALVQHGAQRRGRFVVQRELGRGGQGRVFLARDVELDRDVVLKRPLSTGLASGDLLAEARAAARIVHPNIVTVHEVITTVDPPILVLEHVPGGSLQDLLHEHGTLDDARTIQIARDLLAGLGRLHEAGLVHGDVKPANVLLDAHGMAKLADFGIAAASGLGHARRGTPGFVAPEVARGASPDVRSDVWSAAAVLHTIRRGQFPTPEDETRDHLAAATALAPVRAPAETDPMTRVLDQALSADPAARPADAGALWRALADATTVPRESVDLPS